jgi:DNA-binding response OmpR family regulator
MPGKVAVLCWEESRPWVSALRQEGYSVPWVDEPKADIAGQVSAAPPDALVVDLTRDPEQGESTISMLVSSGTLTGIPVILVMERGAPNGLSGKVEGLSETTPAEIVAAVRAALAAR